MEGGTKMTQQMDPKEWMFKMDNKFLLWRKKNRYSGQIQVREVTKWTQEFILEMQENDKTA